MKYKVLLEKYGVIINDVSGYVNLLVRITHIICNHPVFLEAFERPSASEKLFWSMDLVM